MRIVLRCVARIRQEPSASCESRLIVVFGFVATPMALAQPDGSSRRPGAAAGKTIEKPWRKRGPRRRARRSVPASSRSRAPTPACDRRSVSVGVGTRAR